MKVFASPLWPMSWFHGMNKIDLIEENDILNDGDIDLVNDPVSLCELIGVLSHIATSSESYATKIVTAIAKLLNIEDRLYPRRLTYEEGCALRQSMNAISFDGAMDLALSIWFIDRLSVLVVEEDTLTACIPHFGPN